MKPPQIDPSTFSLIRCREFLVFSSGSEPRRELMVVDVSDERDSDVELSDAFCESSP